MADLEPRVAQLEHDMQSLRTKIETIDEDMRNIPDLINTQFRLANSQFARVFMEMGQLRDEVNGLKRALVGVESKVDALPRVIADMMAEQKRGS